MSGDKAQEDRRTWKVTASNVNAVPLTSPSPLHNPA